MRIDCRVHGEPGALDGTLWLFQVVEIATGQVLDGRRCLFYADTEKATIRCYDLDECGRFFCRPVPGDPHRQSIAWTEYYCPTRIEPIASLAPQEMAMAKKLIARALEAESVGV